MKFSPPSSSSWKTPNDDNQNELEQNGNNARAVDALGRRAMCIVGVELLQRCVVPGSVMRTFWQRAAPN